MTDPQKSPAPRQPGQLDWRGAEHWSHAPGPCITCGGWTYLRNDAGDRQHKVCAEDASRRDRKGAEAA